MSDFDTMLWRQLRSGNEYDALFPKSLCKSTYVGNGNTDFSIDEMEKVINQYAFQTEKVAKKLQRTSLKATTDTIHDFLFNHFQYLADESNQLLRSPACSWFTRKKGIDCKSYTILGMSLCLNLNLIAYIRKIKQPGYAPDEYTHVYVIVPKDQQTGSLESGYYVIDGTLKSNIEPAFIGKSDLQMSLQHYSLNGPTERSLPLNGTSLSINNLKDLAKKPSLKNLSAIFSGIFCGASAFTQSMSNVSLAKIEEYYSSWMLRLNTAIQNRDFINVSMLVAEFSANTTCFRTASQSKKSQGFNSCTSARIEANTKAFLFYDTIIRQMLMAYMSEYFTPTSGGQTFTAFSEGSEGKYGFHFTNSKQEFVIPSTYNNVQPKPIDIPAFSIPKQVIDQTNTGTKINLDSILQLMEAAGTVLAVVSPSTNPIDPQTGMPTGGEYIKDLPDNKTSNAGMTYLVGGAILIAGIAVATTKFKK